MHAEPNYNQVLATVCEELQKMFPDEGPVTANTDMTRDIPLDSAGTMALVFELETKLDVSLPLNDLANVTRVDDLVALILKLRQTPLTDAS